MGVWCIAMGDHRQRARPVRQQRLRHPVPGAGTLHDPLCSLSLVWSELMRRGSRATVLAQTGEARKLRCNAKTIEHGKMSSGTPAASSLESRNVSVMVNIWLVTLPHTRCRRKLHRRALLRRRAPLHRRALLRRRALRCRGFRSPPRSHMHAKSTPENSDRGRCASCDSIFASSLACSVLRI